MTLKSYRNKRDFRSSPEPEGNSVRSSGDALLFVVQRHEASHLHYDFRLEWKGKLISWAMPKGPSMNPADKRLAVHVEDHPLDYAHFQGRIPKENYGAGWVQLWDTGQYIPIDDHGRPVSKQDFDRNFRRGSLRLLLQGKLLKGHFTMVRLPDETRKHWLLIKEKDEHAQDKPYEIESHFPSGGRRDPKSPSEPQMPKTRNRSQKKASSAPPFDPVKPMLARIHPEPFDDPQWIFEIKWDGYRALAEVRDDHISLYSRKGTSFLDRFPEIGEELSQIDHSLILDGEIVAVDHQGIARFPLISESSPREHPILYYIFDLLYLDGMDLRHKPLIKRKEILKTLIPDSRHLRYVDHIEESGVSFFQALSQRGIEGKMAKKRNSRYSEGKRSPNWWKIKVHQSQEAVIAGYIQKEAKSPTLRSLILGEYRRGKLLYIGKVGVGFNSVQGKDILSKLHPLNSPANPFDDKTMPITPPPQWVIPHLVCQIQFAETTAKGRRRHPVFQGLREDKDAEDLRRESLKKKDQNPDSTTPMTSPMPDSKTPRKIVNLTNLDKIYWPEKGYSKKDLIDYYTSVYKYIIPYLRGRPQPLRRHPDGINGKSIYQKDAGDQAPEWLDTYRDWSDSAQKSVHYLLCNNKPSLRYLANQGCIEIHPWHSLISRPDHPDYLVLDLDPSEENRFSQVVDCALTIREILEMAGVNSYCKTSGATGLYVFIPLGGQYTYKQSRQVAELIMRRVWETLPETTTMERILKKRGKNTIYLVCLQNKEGATLVSPYSLRPLSGAPVSTPLDWKELKRGIHPLDFHIKNTQRRLEKKGDIWAPVLKKGIQLRKVLERWD